MSDVMMPDTNNIQVAMIAAALTLSSLIPLDPKEDTIESRISNFKKAYQAVQGVVSSGGSFVG